MLYRVAATTLNLRIAPGSRPGVAVLYRVPIGTILKTDLTVDDAGQPARVGYDDPTTPQPARVSAAWVRVIAFQRPGFAWEELRTPVYAAYEWLVLERDAQGVPL